VDYTESALPKVSKHVQTKAMRDALRKRIDKLENLKVKERSEGRCEIAWSDLGDVARCGWPASEVHHLISGHGKRARGPSLLAEHKQHACPRCHNLITTKRLKRIGGEAPHYTDVYVRVK
jgi:hypothetical protein